MRLRQLPVRFTLFLLGLTLAACCRTDQTTSCNNTSSSTTAGSSDGTGNNVRFNQLIGIAVDAAGNLFVSDTGNNTIRKVTSAGVATTVAGSAGNVGSTDGNAQNARFNQPGGIAVDVSGNLYVADTQNNTIRKITSAGVVSTLAGSAGQTGQVDGVAGNARFNQPWGVVLDTAGNLYVADTGNDTVRKITPTGIVTTLAGSAGNVGSSDGNGSNAQFNLPLGIAIDSATNLYIADTSNNTIRKLTPAGDVSTLAGSSGNSGSNDGSGTRASFNQPNGIVVDSSGNIRIADTGNQLIRSVSASGIVSTIAGAAGNAGSADGNGNNAKFNQPKGIAADAANNLYVADTGNNLLRKVTPGGQVTTLLSGGSGSSCLCLFNF
ncbi:NHL repeat-containing protein [Collimonas arenae]|uniref:NHL repeat-containing protein n=1 Tax=Collimonas arenae TaxID=279058 RepID=UPI0006894676|nr:NHL repeat-containing protein [Collimonas arenae]